MKTLKLGNGREAGGEGEITPGGISTHETRGTRHLIINTKEQAWADMLPGSLSIFQLLFYFQVIGWAVIAKNLDAKILFDHQTCYYHETAGHFHVPGGSFHLLSAKFKLWHIFWGGKNRSCSIFLLLKKNIILLS